MTIIDESWYTRPKDRNLKVRKGAGGVIVRLEEQRILVGLVRGNGFKNYILPKGGTERNESPLATAKREIEEETGIRDLNLIGDLGVKERLTFERNYWSSMHYFLFFTKQKDGVPTDILENYTIEWFDLDNLPQMFWPEQKEVIEMNKENIKSSVSDYLTSRT